MDNIVESIKAQGRMYKGNLVTFDHIMGYLAALLDCDLISQRDVQFILETLLSDDAERSEWLYE